MKKSKLIIDKIVGTASPGSNRVLAQHPKTDWGFTDEEQGRPHQLRHQIPPGCSGQVRQQLETLIANREILLTRFTQLELLQGSLNEQEWTILSTYLEVQDYVELKASSWQAAARI